MLFYIRIEFLPSAVSFEDNFCLDEQVLYFVGSALLLPGAKRLRRKICDYHFIDIFRNFYPCQPKIEHVKLRRITFPGFGREIIKLGVRWYVSISIPAFDLAIIEKWLNEKLNSACKFKFRIDD